MELSSSADSCDPYSRPARRTQWIVSALAYHYGLDRGVENEIIVLATGLDQYLQEIFHHLDYEGEGRIPGEDFRILCEVLGLEQETEECAGILDELPAELSFRQFHAKLCGYFSTKAGCPCEDGRLPVGKESEHIETQIRLRSPLRRRRSTSRQCGATRGAEGFSRHPSPDCSQECYEDIVALEEAEDRIFKLEDENNSLRELVEDMRAALQSSDARSLAVQVGLRKSHVNHKANGGCFLAARRLLAHKNRSQNSKCLQSMLKEMELIRSSRDGQIEEAMRFNEELEKELQNSKEALMSLEKCNTNLKKEQAEMRKKVEDARQAVLRSLGKVKELESKANTVPLLQRRIEQQESELKYLRSEMAKLQLLPQNCTEKKSRNTMKLNRSHVSQQPGHRSPSDDMQTVPENVEDQMFRSVEGQAASDEEEEKWTGEQQSQVLELKKLLTKLSSCCSSGCDDRTVKRLLSQFGNTDDESKNVIVELVERIVRFSEQVELKEVEVKKLEIDRNQIKDSLLHELQQKAEEAELLQMELQMLETERVRLSLVEEKLMDVLQLLQKLRDLNVSRRALGKILLNTLESYNDPQRGKDHVLEVLDTLYHELAACELLSGKSLEKAQSHQSLTNTLLISC
ncbi:EF-hand and coiled-coil domain-containing protein 1 [Protopterus annectens]|uniref:EF-hand and coiled-coil domain-containing protein 1 n=1 Tax=Protopterus annectens TaxID=7888 RepID=UPI001CFBD375|nr:EF-hand and coiled-coil domain-containing protein 1 [Protopterus annectens]